MKRGPPGAAPSDQDRFIEGKKIEAPSNSSANYNLGSDNGPEFTVGIVRTWLGVQTLFIERGSP